MLVAGTVLNKEVAMSRRFGVATKVHQVVLEDLEAWIQQLDEEVRGRCYFEVAMLPAWANLKPSVRLEVMQYGVGKEVHQLWEGYEVVSETEQGAVEAAMLRLASKALLEIQREVEGAERRQRTLFDA